MFRFELTIERYSLRNEKDRGQCLFYCPMVDKKLKSLLNRCAICAVRHDRELKAYYERKVKDGKSKMLVINNVRAKLLARAFAVINRDTPFVNTCKFAA